MPASKLMLPPLAKRATVGQMCATARELNGHPFAGAGGLAVAELPAAYAPPAPGASVGSAFADDFEVKVFRDPGGFKLAAAIELVSPANKDRSESRLAFTTKCAELSPQWRRGNRRRRRDRATRQPAR